MSATKARKAKGRNPARTKRIPPTAIRSKRSLTSILEELNEAREQQAATAEILKVINASPGNLTTVFDVILEKAHSLCDVPCGSLQLLDGDHTRAVAVRGMSEPFEKFLRLGYRLDRGQPVQLIRPFQIDDLAKVIVGAPHGSPLRVAFELGRIRTMLSVPLVRDAVVLGCIVAARQEVRPFSEHQIAVLRSFADQAVIAIENARLFNETKEALERQTATADILKVIASSPDDVQPVFAAIATSANRLLGGFSTAVIRFIEGMAYLQSFTPTNPTADEVLKSHFPRIIDGFEAARLALRGEPSMITDTDNVEDARVREIARLRGFRSMLFVPLMNGAVPIGTISVTRVGTGSFADHHIRLLQTFADQAVIAIENVRLFNETQEALARQTATADVLKVIASSPSNLQPVFDAIAERSKALIGAHSTTVVRYVDGMIQLASFTPISPEADATLRAMFPRPPEAGNPRVQQVLRGEIARITDAESEIEVQALRDAARARGWRSLLLVPLKDDTDVIGWISVTRTGPGAFGDKDVELLRTFADQAVIAISNVELFQQVQARTRDLQESLEQQTATSEVLEVISASPGELEPVFRKMLENATHVCGANFGMMQLWNGEAFSTAAAYNVPPAFAALREGKPIHVHHPQSGLSNVLKSHQVVHIHDVTKGTAYLGGDPNVVQLADIGGARTVVLVPMLKEDEFIGTFTIYRQEVRPFTDKQIALVENFTKQAVIAIENTRLLRELRERTDDLSTSLDELRSAQDRLIQTEKLASLGQLTAGIAHEIKNPLNFVNNFSALSAELTGELNDLLKNATLTDKMRKEVGELTRLLQDNLEKVVQHGKRADSIVKNMLLHSREGSAERRSADINSLVGESLNLAYHGARAEKAGFSISLKHDFDPDAGALEIYPQEMTRALLNLISNGFYAATKRKIETSDETFEPVLSAATRSLGKTIEIRIRDNGPGILPEVKEKMFNPFFTTKPTGEGTGLGLSMTYDIIVKQHGGRIDVETEPGSYTEFIITLPRNNAGASQKPE